MVPGIFDDGARWLQTQTPGAVSLGPMPLMIQLADAGYDVWVGSVRGTENALEYHKDALKADYWDFTWDDIARYDIPAMINAIKTKTKMDKVFYVGYSEGATAMI